VGPAPLPGAPGSVEAIASTSPGWASEITRRTPARPLASRPRRNAVQPAPSSEVCRSRPRISRAPAAFTPVAITVDGGDPAGLADLLGDRVEPHVRVGGPPSGGRLRNASTAASSSLAISDTRDLEIRSIPSVRTRPSMRRVETPLT
jgi:hypothetical protein